MIMPNLETIDGRKEEEDTIDTTSQMKKRRGAKCRTGELNRRYQRLNISKRVEYMLNDKSTFAYTKDIGSGGMFLRSSAIISIGDELEFNIFLDTNQEPVTISGMIVRIPGTSEENGFGVSFSRSKSGCPKARAQISEFVLDTLENRALERTKLNPRDIRSLKQIASIWVERNNPNKAEEYYGKALKIQPTESEASGCLAQLQFARAVLTKDKNLYIEALRLFDIAVSGGLAHFEEELIECRRLFEKLKQNDHEAVQREQEVIDTARQEIEEKARHNESMAQKLEHQQEGLDKLSTEIKRATETLRDEQEIFKSTQNEFEKARAEQETRAEELKHQEKHLEDERQQIEDINKNLKAKNKENELRWLELSKLEKQLVEERETQKREEETLAETRQKHENRVKELNELDERLTTERQKITHDREEFDKDEKRLAKERFAIETQMNELETKKQQISEFERSSNIKFEQIEARLKVERIEVDEAHIRLDTEKKYLVKDRENFESLLATLQEARQELNDFSERLAIERQKGIRDREEFDEDKKHLAKERLALESQKTELEMNQQKLSELEQSSHRKFEQIEARLKAERIEVDETHALLDTEKGHLVKDRENYNIKLNALKEAQQEFMEAEASLSVQKRAFLELEQDMLLVKEKEDAQTADLAKLKMKLEADRNKLAIDREKLNTDVKRLKNERLQLENQRTGMKTEQQLHKQTVAKTEQLLEDLKAAKFRETILEEKLMSMSENLNDAHSEIDFKREMLAELHLEYEKNKTENQDERRAAQQSEASNESKVELSSDESMQMKYATPGEGSDSLEQDRETPQEKSAPEVKSDGKLGEKTRAVVMCTDFLRYLQMVLRDSEKNFL